MHFEVVHEFDIPLDALELAVLSPDLHAKLAERLTNVARIDQKEHCLVDGRLDRVWSFHANIPVPAFAQRHVTPEMMAWDERSQYDLGKHAATWKIEPNIKPEWRKHFASSGSYALEPLGSGRTRRTVSGSVELFLPIVQKVATKLILSEVRKIFDAEATTLRDLATLI